VASTDPSSSVQSHEPAFESVRELAFETCGVHIGVRANDDRVAVRLPELIPPHSQPCDPGSIEHRFNVTTDDGVTFTVRYDIRDGISARVSDAVSYIASDVDLGLALGLLESYLHSCVGLHAVDRFFVHAGAVGYRDRMIVLPGEALTGKSTLVAALVDAGATYYSDEFAVFDEQGRVHPYATPLRAPGAGQEGDGRQPVPAGRDPLPLGAVVVTSYRPGAEWSPRRIPPGEASLALLGLTVPAHERQEQSMRALRRAFEADPLLIASHRGEADQVAPLVLAELERQFPAPAR
jgi:hypothetical protein